MSETRIRIEGRTGRITLTRPKALNALSRAMLRDIDAALVAWADDPAVALVLLDAEGERAFCAGGDIAEIHRTATAGDFETGRDFWEAEYAMDARVAGYPKPVVAFMQGYVMGGGVGLGGHATHRIVGESTRIAMPECAIGLVPDVGGSHLLAQAPGRLGEYLGLTGHRMDPAEALAAGFADHFVPLDRWPETKARLLATADPSAATDHACPPPASAPGGFEAHRAAIDVAFAAPTVAAIRAALPGSDWGRATAAVLDGHCALSMACTLALVRAARDEPGVPEALKREYRFTHRAHSDGELIEGIRAAVIDKDRKPRWRHRIDTLPAAQAEAMLAPLGDRELAL
jgi:enoyl-CoA hydratase